VDHGSDGTEVTAVPDTGYHFVDWSDGVATAARTDIAVTGNITVTANFAINQYTLTYTAGANGSITGTSPQSVDHGNNGSEVTAVPDTGYHFVDWSDGVATAARTDLAVTGDITVTANFAINQYTLTYTAGANGSVSGTLSQIVNHGDDGATVVATPDTGYHFTTWSDTSTDNPRTDTAVTHDIDVMATFEADTTTCTSPIRNSSGQTETFSNTITDAYSAADTGDTLEITKGDYPEGELTMDRDITVTLSGGYSCDFTTREEESAIQGSLVISDGTVIVDEITIK
jgi:hypothetical protein